jgi:hypothetical protein
MSSEYEPPCPPLQPSAAGLGAAGPALVLIPLAMLAALAAFAYHKGWLWRRAPEKMDFGEGRRILV